MPKVLLFCCLVIVSTSSLATKSPWFVPGSLELDEQEIEFNAEDGAVLSGTLLVPAGMENAPAVVIPQQTRTHYRDNPLYMQTAKAFNSIGFAAFVYDRRGKGKSGGEMPQTDYHLLAGDAVAAREAIAESDAVDGERIGYWGISQSGWISMEAAARDGAAFVVVVSSPLTTPGEQMKVYTRNRILVLGHGDEAADKAAALWHSVMDEYMRGEIEYEQARQLLREAEEQPWFADADMIGADDLPEDISGAGWLNEMDYDPTGAWERIEAPILFQLGGKDWVISVRDTLEIIDSLEPAGPRDVDVIDSADHGMIVREETRILSDEEAAELGERDRIADSEVYFMRMGNWLGRLLQE